VCLSARRATAKNYNETRKILALLISKDKNTQDKIKGHAKAEILRVGGPAVSSSAMCGKAGKKQFSLCSLRLSSYR
jgi:hypothetical protein